MSRTPEIQIGNRKVGAGNPCYVIAELSANHNQDFDLAVQTVHAAAAAGVDAIKLQTYRADTLTLNSDLPHFMTRADSIWAGQKLYDLYLKAYTPWEWQPLLKNLAEELGIQCFSSPFDGTSVEFLENMNVDAYKIASFEITDIPLIELVASKNKPVIISTGIADKTDIESALAACKRMGNSQIVLLKCTSAYPTPLEDVNLRTIPLLAQKFNTVVGLSDHTLGLSVPTAAVALGASIVEKHIILDKKLGGVDSSFSLDADEFSELVSGIRNTEKALGVATLEPSEKMVLAKQGARSLFAITAIKAGEKFTPQNVKSLRPGLGMAPRHYTRLLGKTALVDISKGTPLEWSLVNS